MKILFLDIDGVLVNRKSLKGRSGLRAVADPSCVNQLNRITRETGAKIVLASSWRFCGLEEMRLILRHWGVEADMIGMTPDLTRTPEETGSLYEGVPRGREIQSWLDENPHPEAFAIIDDDADMEHLKPRLVKTAFEVGISSDDAGRVIALLMP